MLTTQRALISDTMFRNCLHARFRFGGIIIFGMKLRTLVLVVGVVLLVTAGVAALGFSLKPQILQVSPSTGAQEVAATASLRILFSRAMDQASVITRLKIEPAVEGTYHWEGNSLSFTPNQPWPSNTEVIIRLQRGALAANRLAFPMGAQSFSFVTCETALAYLWPSSGPADIYALDPGAGTIRQYTRGMDVLDYSTSVDGRFFYFSAGNAQDGADLYRLDRIADEASPELSYQPQRLLDCGVAQCRNPVVSADGLLLAYEYLLPTKIGGLGPAQIWTLSLPGLVAKPVGQEGDETVQPGWSLTGLLAFYDRTKSWYEVYNPATGERVQLLNQTGQPGTWSQDGKYYLAPEISYQQLGGSYETGSSHLYRYHIQDNLKDDISGQVSVEDVEAAYSPDGGMIAFTRKFLDAEHWTLGRQIWIMSLDGSNAHPISDEADYNHYDLAWSRDGSRLAYVRFNQAQLSEPPELWMMNADGSNPLQLVIGGYSPTWIP